MSMDPNDFFCDTPGEWAYRYRTLGIQVLACKGKIPIEAWKEFQTELVSDGLFAGWYGPKGKHATNSSMGMVTGAASGWKLMLDLDTYKSEKAAAWWSEVLATWCHGQEPVTWEQLTGGGGRQLFFECPNDWMPANASTDLDIDIRGKGGFAVLPPTVHASGRKYAWKPGHEPWAIPCLPIPPWLMDEIEKLIEEHGGAPQGKAGDKPAYQGDWYTWKGTRINGRERYARDLVWAALIGLRIASPIAPVGNSELDKVFADYLRNLSPQTTVGPGETVEQALEREGRGKSMFAAKWRYAMSKWDTEIKAAAEERVARGPGAGDSSSASGFERDFPNHGQQQQQQSQQQSAPNTYRLLDPDQVKAMPEPTWLLQDIIVDRGLGFVYGDPGTFKSFITLDIGLSIACGEPQWWGYKLAKMGAVIYVSSEGHAFMPYRYKAWEKNRARSTSGAPFYLMSESTNFGVADDRARLIATLDAAAVRSGVPIQLIVVDTVSKSIAGVNENMQDAMSLFIEACEKIRDRFGCATIGVHHTNKQGGFRGSSVMPGAGDFILKVTRNNDGTAMTGKVYAEKIKEGGIDKQTLAFEATKKPVNDLMTKESLVVDVMSQAQAKAHESVSDDTPDLAKQREILAALAQAWFAGEPWQRTAQSANPAVNRITVNHRMTHRAAKAMLDNWVARGVIRELIHPSNRKLKGYMKLTEI